jgi:hypothetical protein
MSLIVYLALIAAAVVALRRGPAQALLAVYLPVLLLIPDSFRAITPGLPDPTFSQAAMVPLFAIVILRHGRDWQPRLVDLMVVAYGVIVGYSDFLGRGYNDAQNLMFAMLFAVIGPYFVARLVITSEAMQVAVARRFVILLFAAALVGLFEARFGFNPFHVYLRPFFPGQGLGWVTTFRHGMARVAGPFSHAILAGIMMVIAYRLQRWLEWGRHWEPRFTRPIDLPWDKARVIRIVLAVAAFMTVARGPWIGAAVAAAIDLVARARDRRRALAIASAALAAGAAVGVVMLAQYLDIQPGVKMTMSQESALYRKVLFEKYFAIALDHAWFGWGLTTWPKVPGMESIDNYWLLLSLMHGLPALGLLVGMMTISVVQCLRRGLAEPTQSPSLAFTFAGIFIAIFVSLGTVYLGEQVLPTLFFLLGWAQALQISERRAIRSRSNESASARVQAAPAFRACIC